MTDSDTALRSVHEIWMSGTVMEKIQFDFLWQNNSNVMTYTLGKIFLSILTIRNKKGFRRNYPCKSLTSIQILFSPYNQYTDQELNVLC